MPYRPAIAASGSSVYVAWDDGLTWLDPGDPPGQSSAQFVPLAQTGTNVVAVWEDRRNSIANQDPCFNLAPGGQPTGAGKAGSGGFVPALALSGFAWTSGGCSWIPARRASRSR